MIHTEQLSKDKVKELAGDKWSEEMEERYNAEWEKNGESLTFNDVKVLFPRLCVDPLEKVSLELLKEITLKGAGVEWNDQFEGVFMQHKTNEGEDGSDVIEFGLWMTTLPMLFETPEERQVRMAAEYKIKLAARAEGNIVINYQMYNEEFPVSKNSITAERVDEDYGLYDVMPGCRIRLSALEPKRRTEYVNNYNSEAPWVKEEPEGTFQELMAGETYYCIVIENPTQHKLDMQRLAKDMVGVDKNTEVKRAQEGCSCLFGNPCQDPYVCKDWDHRWEVSIKNGMSDAELKRAGLLPS